MLATMWDVHGCSCFAPYDYTTRDSMTELRPNYNRVVFRRSPRDLLCLGGRNVPAALTQGFDNFLTKCADRMDTRQVLFFLFPSSQTPAPSKVTGVPHLTSGLTSVDDVDDPLSNVVIFPS